MATQDQHTTPIFSEQDETMTGGGAGDEIASPDLPLADLIPTKVGGGADKRPTYTIVSVNGGNLPSASSKFVGATPRAAVLKAARRIHKRSGGKTEFDILMRRVSARKVDKKLYKYSVVMKRATKPDGFVTLVDPSFKKTDGSVERNASKKVRIVAASAHPVYGHIASDGTLAKGPAADGKFNVVRGDGTDTLTLIVTGDIPKDIYGINVVKTEWEVASIKDAECTDQEKAKYDIAGVARETADEAAAKKAAAKKAAIEKRRTKDRADKEKAKEAARNLREKERAKKEAEKAKEAARKEKLRNKEKARKEKERAAAKSSTTTKRAKKMTGGAFDSSIGESPAPAEFPDANPLGSLAAPVM